jgi:RHS repeat-associated protein
VTDGLARVLQHEEYFPSGETWVEEVLNNDRINNRSPYLFNAKELDETGLYYFGARYYDPRQSMWQSTDPALSSFMGGAGSGGGAFFPRNLALYGYSINNPVVVRDPDGQDWFPQNWNPFGDAFDFGQETVKRVDAFVATNTQAFLNGAMGPREYKKDEAGYTAFMAGVVAGELAIVFAFFRAKPAPVAAEAGVAAETGVAAREGTMVPAEAEAAAGRSASSQPPAVPAEAPVHRTFRPGPYAAESIPARSKAKRFTTDERARNDEIGYKRGCHTCGAPHPGTKSGHWVPDHQPVSDTVPDGTPQRLYPHCIHCSREQGLEAARRKREE